MTSLWVESSDVLPLVDVEIAFPAGSLHDPIGREGLAQLTGFLVRRGPKGISQERFEDTLASLGARVSVEISMRSTRIRATVLRHNFQRLLALLARLVWRPALRARDFSKLKRQAEAVLRARLDDDQTLGAVNFRKFLFRDHPYGRPPAGTDASLATIDVEHARRFYKRHLARGSFIVGVAGDVTRADAEQLVKHHFPKPRGIQRSGP